MSKTPTEPSDTRKRDSMIRSGVYLFNVQTKKPFRNSQHDGVRVPGTEYDSIT